MKKNKKLGFTLIEIVTVILISSIISLSLYQMLKQSSKTVAAVVRIIDTDLPIMPFYNQLELDITGMFAPESSIESYVQKLKKVEENSKENNETKEESTNSVKTDIDQKNKKDVNIKPVPEVKEENKEFIKNIFYIKTNPGFIFSFITTAGIQTLEFDGSLKPTTFVRRVAYTLETDEKIPNTFKIIYKCDSSSSLLNIENIQSPNFTPSYELISGIKDLKIRFTVFEFKQKEDDENQGNKDQKNVKLTEWQEEDIFQKYQTLIPAYILFKGTLVEPNGVEHPFEFEFKVPAYSPYRKNTPNVQFKSLLKN